MKTQAISFIALVCAAVCTACGQQTAEQKLDAYFDVYGKCCVAIGAGALASTPTDAGKCIG